MGQWHSTEHNLQGCKDHPGRCARQLATDGLVIVASYALLAYLVDGKVVQLSRAATFYGLFMLLAFAFRALDVDFQEQLTRVAGFQLGTKLMLALTG